MYADFECVPCFLSQTISCARQLGISDEDLSTILKKIFEYLSSFDFKKTPPYVGKVIHSIIKKVIKNPDPYRKQKKLANKKALQILPLLKEKVKNSDNPFKEAVVLAIAGNIIDLAINPDLDIIKTIEEIEKESYELNDEDLNLFKSKIESAKNILYLCDNAGEIVFDKLLISFIPKEKLTIVVRGEPIINDATLEDAKMVGLLPDYKVISNGDSAPGTLLECVSEEFIKEWNKADFIISKGQGNLESLWGVKEKNIAFLLKVKCDLVSKKLNIPKGNICLKFSNTLIYRVD